MKRADVLKTPRLAGGVRRYHAWPVHHVRQTNAEHSFHVLRIWLQCFGALLPHVTQYIIFHDLGEIVTGDPPFPVKARNPTFKEEHDRLEQQALAAMGYPLPELSEYERVLFKFCDLCEMWEYGTYELQMGNRYAIPIIKDVGAGMAVLSSKLLPDHKESARAYVLEMARVLTGRSEACMF